MNGIPIFKYLRTEFVKGQLPRSKLEKLCIVDTLKTVASARYLLDLFKSHVSAETYNDFYTFANTYTSHTHVPIFAPVTHDNELIVPPESAVYEYGAERSAYVDMFEQINRALSVLMRVSSTRKIEKILPSEILELMNKYSAEVMIKTLGSYANFDKTELFLRYIMSYDGRQIEILEQIFSTFGEVEISADELGIIRLYLAFILQIPYYTTDSDEPIHVESYVAYILTVVSIIIAEKKEDFFIEEELSSYTTIQHIVGRDYNILYAENLTQSLTTESIVFIASKELLFKLLAHTKLQLLIICCFEYDESFEKKITKSASRIVFAPLLLVYASPLLAQDLHRLLSFVQYFAHMKLPNVKRETLPNEVSKMLDDAYLSDTKNTLILSAQVPVLMNNKDFLDTMQKYFVKRGAPLTNATVISLIKTRLVHEMLFFNKSSENLYQYMKHDPDNNIHEMYQHMMPLLFYAISIHDNKLFDYLINIGADIQFHLYYDGKIITPYEHAVTHGNSYAEKTLRRRNVKIVSKLRKDSRYILKENNKLYISMLKVLDWQKFAHLSLNALKECIITATENDMIDDTESLDLLFASLIRIRFPFVIFEQALVNSLTFVISFCKKKKINELYIDVSDNQLYMLFGKMLEHCGKIKVNFIERYTNIAVTEDETKTHIIVFRIDDTAIAMRPNATFLAVVPYDRYISRKLLLLPENVTVYNTMVDLFCTCLLFGMESSACASFKYLYINKMYRKLL
jgi:hypothetical protein